MSLPKVTDIYTLANFPSLRTLIREKRAEAEAAGGTCIRSLYLVKMSAITYVFYCL